MKQTMRTAAMQHTNSGKRRVNVLPLLVVNRAISHTAFHTQPTVVSTYLKYLVKGYTTNFIMPAFASSSTEFRTAVVLFYGFWFRIHLYRHFNELTLYTDHASIYTYC